MLEADSAKSLFLNWVTNKYTVSHLQGVASTKDTLSLLAVFVNIYKRNYLLVNDRASFRCPVWDVCKVDSSHSLNDKVILSKSSGFVEAADTILQQVIYYSSKAGSIPTKPLIESISSKAAAAPSTVTEDREADIGKSAAKAGIKAILKYNNKGQIEIRN